VRIIEKIKVPTGYICIGEGEKGKIEFLSIGDYGKDKNVKADFMGIKRDIDGVPNGEIMPLSEKWVITISTQYGCSMKCNFCDVPLAGKGLNATFWDMKDEIVEGLKLFPDITATKRLNIHFARMGEPTFNFDVLEIAYRLHNIVKPYIGNSLIHPVVSTMMPKNNRKLFEFLQYWTTDIKNDKFRGDAGLQLSINSTSDLQRETMFGGCALSLDEISYIGNSLPEPKGRKYALNFALADTSEIAPDRLKGLFDTEKFMIKITPLHLTRVCKINDIKTSGGYSQFTPYKKVEEDLRNKGFDVLVFIPSYDEDLSRITCGNAILSGSRPFDFTIEDYKE
jgi:23S rRNA (adenine2503-C2)-methyltransferase